MKFLEEAWSLKLASMHCLSTSNSTNWVSMPEHDIKSAQNTPYKQCTKVSHQCISHSSQSPLENEILLLLESHIQYSQPLQTCIPKRNVSWKCHRERDAANRSELFC